MHQMTLFRDLKNFYVDLDKKYLEMFNKECLG